MTRTFSDRHPKVLPACNFLSQYYFYNIFLQKSCRFSLQTLTKFEAAKTGSGVRFLRLTAVCERALDQSSGLVLHRKSAIHGLPIKSDWSQIRNECSAHTQKIGCGQSSRSLPQARRIVGSGDENEKNQENSGKTRLPAACRIFLANQRRD